MFFFLEFVPTSSVYTTGFPVCTCACSYSASVNQALMAAKGGV